MILKALLDSFIKKTFKKNSKLNTWTDWIKKFIPECGHPSIYPKIGPVRVDTTHTQGGTPPNSYFPEHKPHTSGNIPDIPQYLASTSQEHLDHVSPIRNVTDTIHTIWASTTLGQSTLLRSMLDSCFGLNWEVLIRAPSRFSARGFCSGYVIGRDFLRKPLVNAVFSLVVL